MKSHFLRRLKIQRYICMCALLSMGAAFESAAQASEVLLGDSWPLTRQEVEKQLFLPGRLCVDSNRNEHTCTNVITLKPGVRENEVIIGLSSFSYSFPRPGVKVIVQIGAHWENSKLCFQTNEEYYIHHTLHYSDLAETDVSDSPLPEEEQVEWRKTMLSTLMEGEQEPVCIRFFRTDGTKEDEYQIQDISFSKGKARTRRHMRQVQLLLSGERYMLAPLGRSD